MGKAMEIAKGEYIARGVALIVVYVLAYVAGWLSSLDQWFLPAGVRFAAMILLPFRYWPWLFFADIAALSAIRFPRAGYDNPLWAYFSPFLLPFMAAALPFAFQLRWKTINEKIEWLPVMGVSAGLWGWFCNMVVNASLGGTSSFASFDKLVRFSVGSYLGILIVVLPFLLYLHRKEGRIVSRPFITDALIATLATAAVYAALFFWHQRLDALIGSTENAGSLTLWLEYRPALLAFMVAPAVFLTVRRGWHGGAFGIVLADLAIAITLPDFQREAAHDANTFVAQVILAIVGTALLILGWRSTLNSERLRRSEKAEKEAIRRELDAQDDINHAQRLARESYIAAERALKEQRLAADTMQMYLDANRIEHAEWLKAGRQFSLAMELNTRSLEYRSVYEAYAQGIYPIEIEDPQKGLYAVLHSKPFSDRHIARDMTMLRALRGDAKSLSINLQLAGFRCIEDAFKLLSEGNPTLFTIKARIRSHYPRRGIAVVITASSSGFSQSTRIGTTAFMDLVSRIKAHGGAMKRHHADRISFWLPEFDPVERTPQ
jgi:glucose-6-phosphate-specific signal transduction histidine kinase